MRSNEAQLVAICAIPDYGELAQKQLAQKGADYSDRKAVDAAHNIALATTAAADAAHLRANRFDDSCGSGSGCLNRVRLKSNRRGVHDMLTLVTYVTYAANTSVLPEDMIPANQRWDIVPVPAGDPDKASASITGDILRIVDPDPPLGPSVRQYARFDKLNSMDSAIFDINCKVISITPFGGVGTHEVFGVGFGFDDDMKSLEVGLFTDTIFLGQGDGRQATVPFNTTDGFHTYRIVKNGDVNMQVFADGKLLTDLTIPYGDLPGSVTGSKQVVSTSSQEASVWDIAYVSYSIFSP
ncbi:MAG TPA: hypothetical protein VIH87_10635 [Methylocella sp.]